MTAAVTPQKETGVSLWIEGVLSGHPRYRCHEGHKHRSLKAAQRCQERSQRRRDRHMQLTRVVMAAARQHHRLLPAIERGFPWDDLVIPKRLSILLHALPATGGLFFLAWVVFELTRALGGL